MNSGEIFSFLFVLLTLNIDIFKKCNNVATISAIIGQFHAWDNYTSIEIKLSNRTDNLTQGNFTLEKR